MTKPPKAPSFVRRVPSARRQWRELWKFLDAHDMANEVYIPTVSVLAVELGLADEAATAIYRPVDLVTGSRVKRSLEEYLRGRNSQTSQELTVLRDSLRQAAKIAAEFGTSPLSQKRAGTGGEEPAESPVLAYTRKVAASLKAKEAAS